MRHLIQKQKNKYGFTLVETIIVVALFVIMTTILVNFYLNFSQNFSYLQANVDVSETSGMVVSAVAGAASQADLILSSHTFSSTTYTTSSSTLVLELPSVDSYGTIITGSHDYVVFYTNGSSVYQVTQPAAGSVRTARTKQLSSNLSSLTFTYDNASLSLAQKVDVDVQTQKSVGTQSLSSHLHQQIYLRNK